MILIVDHTLNNLRPQIIVTAANQGHPYLIPTLTLKTFSNYKTQTPPTQTYLIATLKFLDQSLEMDKECLYQEIMPDLKEESKVC